MKFDVNNEKMRKIDYIKFVWYKYCYWFAIVYKIFKISETIIWGYLLFSYINNFTKCTINVLIILK